jgi:hypothetical protein
MEDILVRWCGQFYGVSDFSVVAKFTFAAANSHWLECLPMAAIAQVPIAQVLAQWAGWPR